MGKKLKKSIINFYGVPSFGFQLIVNVEVYYFAAFLTDYAKISAALAGTVLMITSIFDLVWVPTAGVILEKCNMKWGKYRSWLLIGPPFAVLFYILEFSKIGSSTMNAIIISIGFIVSHLIWNIFYAAHIAMNSSMTEVREERIAMASNRGMFNSLGTICFSLVSMPLILMIGKAIGNPAGGYTFTVILGGIIMIACYYALFFMTKDYANAGESTQTGKVEEKMSVGEMLKQIVVNPPLIGLLLGELGRYLGRFVIFGMAFYYFKYVVNNLAVVTIFFTGLSIVCLFGAVITNPLAKKIGERNTYILSLAIFIVGLLIVWALPMNYMSFIVLMFVAYLGYGIPDALGVAMYSSTVEYGEWKTGKNARGFIMSLISFPIKIAIFLRSIIITSVLVGAGYVANMKPTEQLISGIKNGMALIPAIIMIVGLIFIVLLYKITPTNLEKMQKEIAVRKSQDVNI
ncbi:sugar transporter [Clostridium carboxidivorans P7]|uniref:Sugar (Glycoside-Pentoside-Hexuronide) transporter n=1 Tax=Clostridium carboxidivorans P7 TaxID=536227 RepID=C6PZU1_9CLOT|nr:glycoside-pentoside-hexuronide (GPH):cation symporter [Clostridium carboxidivorans]AKN31749.1 sugar transporter [Clostridium carboxidivorans P7]EET85248.1 sugar (Glycoside-Pentoside-Hexuronide) transporter [Clostridium carboxidivorans P7]EFG87425.1 sugar (Glycoside-Pentoside-Hexuronide) transporter [Clostridium carboxidivorans P7]